MNSLPTLSLNVENGQITDGKFFGAKVYVCYGLDATTANQNVIMAGIFTDSRMGVLKHAVNKVKENETLTLKEVKDGDAVRFRSIMSQAVNVIPNLSQMAMNA